MSTTNTNETSTTDSPQTDKSLRESEAPLPTVSDPAGPPPTTGSGDSGDVRTPRP
jgi:hypothetical protein